MCSKLHFKRKNWFIRYQSKGSKRSIKILYSMECLKTDFDVRWSKTSAATIYVCLLLDLLISLYFNRKFTRKLHCLHQIMPPFSPVSSTLCLDSFPVCCQLILYISNVVIISKAISLSNIFRNADLSFTWFSSANELWIYV